MKPVRPENEDEDDLITQRVVISFVASCAQCKLFASLANTHVTHAIKLNQAPF